MRVTGLLWSSLVIPAAVGFQVRFRPSEDTALDTVDDGTLQSLLDNIGLNGSNAWDTRPGLVIASPSKRDPDCMSFGFSRVSVIAADI